MVAEGKTRLPVPILAQIGCKGTYSVGIFKANSMQKTAWKAVHY